MAAKKTIGDSTLIPEQRCWFCDYLMDRASDFDGDKRPSPGDVNICFNCSAVGIFTEELIIRAPSEAELINILSDPEVMFAIGSVAGFQLKEGHKDIKKLWRPIKGLQRMGK